MSDEFVNVHAAKTRFSQLVARAERGERIIISRKGKPVARLTRGKQHGAHFFAS